MTQLGNVYRKPRINTNRITPANEAIQASLWVWKLCQQPAAIHAKHLFNVFQKRLDISRRALVRQCLLAKHDSANQEIEILATSNEKADPAKD
jgi:hypothetical protein